MTQTTIPSIIVPLGKLERRLGRRVTKLEFAQMTGLYRDTIERLTNGSSKRYKSGTKERLMEFFQKEGIPVEDTDFYRQI